MLMTVAQVIHQLEKFDPDLPVYVAEYPYKEEIGNGSYDQPVFAIAHVKTEDEFQEEFVRIYSYLNLDGN